MKPSDIPDDEWIAAFAAAKMYVNKNGKLAVREGVARRLGLSVNSVNNYLQRHPDLLAECREASRYTGVEELLADQGVDEPAEYVPITAAQRAYADEFVAWFRADDLERELRDVRLRHLFARVAAEARRAA